MGYIISTRRDPEHDRKMIVEARLDVNELLSLRGHVDDIHLISDRIVDVPANISLRGRNEATKYFLIPRQLRKDLRFRTNVSCQRIDSEGKAIFVYVVDNY